MGKKIFLGIIIAGGLVILLTRTNTKANTPPVFKSATSEPNESSSRSKEPTFAGSPCTSDCSGHEAGYSWAEDNGIDDIDDCDTAGDNSNSPSFAEGCRDYVEENDTPDDSDRDPND